MRASTRGDGIVGEDVTANIRASKKIPKTLKNAPEFLEVRGEVYMPHEEFQHLCAEQELQGDTPFKILATPLPVRCAKKMQRSQEVVVFRFLCLIYSRCGAKS